MKSYRRGTGEHGNTKHGATMLGQKSPEYVSYCNMLQRCYYPKHNRWYRYGGRGIKVCDRWLGPDGFINFFKDMGFKPTPKHSIDRDDKNGNYELSNCRWATTKLQARDRKRVIRVTVDGIEMDLVDACKKYDRDYDKVRARIRQLKWSAERALEV